jgi:hypothetical protein
MCLHPAFRHDRAGIFDRDIFGAVVTQGKKAESRKAGLYHVTAGG